jgi:hypothetical protein
LAGKLSSDFTIIARHSQSPDRTPLEWGNVVSKEQGAESRRIKSFILENWEIVSLSDRKGAVKLCLAGIAFGGSRPLAGEIVRTSAIVRYRTQVKRLVIITQSGSEYMLGMRQAPQEDDKRRLIRYLDGISGARNSEFLQSASSIQTDILGSRTKAASNEKAKSAKSAA